MFKRVLIANRGEIALRIQRACRELEIEPVVVYSAADAEAIHVQLAEEAYCIGPARAADSYLNMDAILTVAKAAHCDAIHPGYGFLSENDQFADACAEAGIAFIGPSGDVIRAMGNKAAARKLMQSAGVPVVPGSDGAVATAEEAKALAGMLTQGRDQASLRRIAEDAARGDTQELSALVRSIANSPGGAQLLRQVARAPAGRDGAGPLGIALDRVGVVYELQQGGFAVALFAYEHGLVARAKLEGKVLHHVPQLLAAEDGEFVYRKHEKTRSFAQILPRKPKADAQRAGLSHRAAPCCKPVPTWRARPAFCGPWGRLCSGTAYFSIFPPFSF